MKKILVMSDSHGEERNVLRALARFGDVDCVFHLGDFVKDTVCIRKKKKVYAVRGNGDFYSKEKAERIITIAGKRILAVHGHKQRVKSGLFNLALYARECSADIVLFGHTHIPTEQIYENVLLYNPGSLSQYARPTFGIILIENGKVKIEKHMI